jgi:hypothetical protein
LEACVVWVKGARKNRQKIEKNEQKIVQNLTKVIKSARF